MGYLARHKEWKIRSLYLQINRISILTLAVWLACAPSQAQAPSQASAGRQNRRRVGSTDDARLAADAQSALQRRDFQKAIGDLERLARDAPGIAEIHANLGTAYYSVGRYDDAARQAQEALKLKPSLTNAHFFLGLSLAEGGRCQEAVPYLEKDYLRAPEPAMKRTLGTDALRCQLSLNQVDKAVDLLRSLNRDFPDDPDLLYLSSHLYSDLATQASERLLATAPGSYQAHQLNAEVLEIQGKPGEAADEYRKVLSLRPDLAGIHYHLGELLLTGDGGANAQDQARQEFEEELKIDPRNAAAEYELGEMARQSRQWDAAIEHFKRAASLDPEFVDALIGLGKSLVSAGRPKDAVEPLERAVRLQPDNPNAHYQLSFAYRRLGREQEAARELAAYKVSHDKLQSSRLRIRNGMIGNIAHPQTDTPPE
ncbi:MAG TPA: tetratricopeptide repeat protein [Terriglobia bacterium]|nr:tetratricopeptide repeat protein [Terriglobia bacterium]